MRAPHFCGWVNSKCQSLTYKQSFPSLEQGRQDDAPIRERNHMKQAPSHETGCDKHQKEASDCWKHKPMCEKTPKTKKQPSSGNEAWTYDGMRRELSVFGIWFASTTSQQHHPTYKTQKLVCQIQSCEKLSALSFNSKHLHNGAYKNQLVLTSQCLKMR